MSNLRTLGTAVRVGAAFACAAAVIAVGGAAPAVAGSDTTPPPTPLHFFVNGVTGTTVSMQWAPGHLTEPTSWRVLRNGAPVTTRLSSAYTDRNLVPGATYSYAIVAVDAAGNTAPPTRTVTVTTRGPGVVPGSPSNLRVKAVAPAWVTLEFDRPGDEFDVTQYRVYEGGVQVATSYLVPFAGATSTVDIRRLTPGTTHTYTVRADRYIHGLSAPSNTVTVALPTTTDTQPPSAPGGLVATVSPYGCDFADLRWTPSTDNADPASIIDYEISTDGTFNHVLRGTTLSRNVQFFTHGAHTVTVRAVDSSGNVSAPSNTAPFTIDPFCQIEG